MAFGGLTVLWRSGFLLLISALPSMADPVWGGECREAETGRHCILSQTLNNASGEWLATLRLQPDAQAAVLQVLVPQGVHLGSGMAYRVDAGEERMMVYRRCLAAGCEALRNLTASEWQEILRGATMTLVLRPDAGRAPAELDVSLAGLTASSREMLK